MIRIINFVLLLLLSSCQASYTRLNRIDVATYYNNVDVWRSESGKLTFSHLPIEPIYLYFRREPQIVECYYPRQGYSVFKYWDTIGDTIQFTPIGKCSVIPNMEDYIDCIDSQNTLYYVKGDKIFQIINYDDDQIDYHRCDTIEFKMIYQIGKKIKWYESNH